MADAKGKGLCLITSRYPLTDIKKWEGSSYQRLEIDRLSTKEGRALFKKVGVKGSKEEVDTVIEEYNGHALSLTLLSKYLFEDFKGDIRKAKDIPPFHSDREAGGKAHRILLWYEKQLTEAQRSFMKIFSLFRKALREEDFEGVFRSKMETPINQELIHIPYFSFKRMVDNLCDRRLITKGQDDTYTTHPLIKGYFESIFLEKDRKLCHKCIYQYIGSYAPERPETLEEMQPLFEQVYHGCRGGMYENSLYNVYWPRIQRKDEFFLIKKLGAWKTDLGILKSFFVEGDFKNDPFVVEPRAKSYLILETALVLQMVGMVSEAEGQYRKVIEFAISQRDWKSTSVGYQNFAELQIRTGCLKDAEINSRQALRFAMKIKYKKFEYYSIAYYAYALFLMGNMDSARLEFEKADKLQKEYDPSEKFLPFRNTWYSDFLLASGNIEMALKVTKKNLNICKKNNWIDDISLCHRSFASIYRYLHDFERAEDNVSSAFEGTRKTGRQDIEVECLIELARIKLDQGLYQEAESTINQALRICQRCGFKLYEPNAEVVLAKVYLSLGGVEKAEGFADSAYKKARKMHYHWPRVEAEKLLREIS